MYENNFASWLLYMSDLRHCRDLLRQGSRSFHAASKLLPQMYRLPITSLYAFCRVADDEIDRIGSSTLSLAMLHERLDRIYAGRPGNDPVDRAFADVVGIYRIPQAVPVALIEGFEWDIGERQYESLSDLYAYAARVAGTVGTMMAMIMGVRDPAILSRACDLGVAMQLTNIARDVGEDARVGRLYLPRELMRDNGIDPDTWLDNPEFSPALADVVQTILLEADKLYRRSEWGLAVLPSNCRPAMFAARAIYAEIGREIERKNLDSVTQRARVSGRRKLALLLHAIRQARSSHEEDSAPTLREARFLLDAVAGT